MRDRLEQVAGRPVSRETFEKLRAYVELLTAASERQNLISASTIDQIWERHVIDSAQLVRFESSKGASWVDVGSGAGLPGIVIACLVKGPVRLVEPRRLRAEFLQKAAQSLSINATVEQAKIERVNGKFDVITGRAVAALPRFLALCDHLSTRKTLWVLPKGKSAQSELAEARRAWQGVFHVERSATDAEAQIIVGTEVGRKK